MKKIFYKYFIFLLLNVTSGQYFSQNYFDSLNVVIQELPIEEKIAIVSAIPFDKMNNNASAAIKMYHEAIGWCSNNSNSLANICQKLSVAYYYNGDYDLSVKYCLKGIKIYEQNGDSIKAGSIYASLGYQMKRRNLLKAFEYMRKGITRLKKAENDSLINPAYNNFGVLHEMNNNIDSALFYYNKSLSIVRKQNDSIGIPYSLNNIAGAYVILEEYDKAISFYEESFKIREGRGDINGMAENLTYLGDFFFKQNKFNDAVFNYEEAHLLSKKIKYTYLTKVTSEQLAKCYAKLNNYKKALLYQNEASNLKDSLLNESTNKTIQNLEIQFETEKKEKQIVEQKVKLGEEKLRVKQRNYILLALALGLIFILALSYYIYKQQKFKQQKLIEENRLKDELSMVKVQNELHQERLRISRDLHDNIGAQLTFVISSVDNLKYLFKPTDKKIKDKLSDVSNFTRTTITQLRDTIWALNKDEISFDDLKARLYNYIETANLAQEQTKFEVKENLQSTIFLNSIQGVNIYRVVQEAINNSMKYAVATRVELNIAEEDEHLNIKIIDDGVGFNISEIDLGNGLENMKNRAVSINAEFDIKSLLEEGTTISISIPKNEFKLNKTNAV